MLSLLVLFVKQILDKPLSHLFSVRLWAHSSYEEFFGQWWHMGYISWAGCFTLPCWYERSGSSSCGLSERCFPSAEENIKIHLNIHFVLHSKDCCILAILVFNSYFKLTTKSARMHDEYTPCTFHKCSLYHNSRPQKEFCHGEKENYSSVKSAAIIYRSSEPNHFQK